MADPISMFGPDGQVHDVQTTDVDAALKSGGELAHEVKGPDGQVHYVRHSQLGDALRSGGIPMAALQQATSTGTIGNAPTGVKAYLQNLEGDVRYGTGTTAPGRILRAMGATGVDAGQGKGVADAVASLPLGVIRAAQGVADIPQHPLQGTKTALGGVLQAATIPGGFIAPEAADAVTNAIPSTKYAGYLFNQAKQAAGNLPVNVSGAGDAALRAQELAENGGKMPTLLSKFLRKATAPGGADIDYDAARDFYSNSGQQSVIQKLTTSPQMKRQITQFRSSLGDAIQATADQAGVGDEYRQALQEYHRAMVAKGLGKAALVLAAIKAGHAVLGSGAMGAINTGISAVP